MIRVSTTHVSDADYQIEITVAVYTQETIGMFDDESQRVLSGHRSGEA